MTSKPEPVSFQQAGEIIARTLEGRSVDESIKLLGYMFGSVVAHLPSEQLKMQAATLFQAASVYGADCNSPTPAGATIN